MRESRQPNHHGMVALKMSCLYFRENVYLIGSLLQAYLKVKKYFMPDKDPRYEEMVPCPVSTHADVAPHCAPHPSGDWHHHWPFFSGETVNS